FILLRHSRAPSLSHLVPYTTLFRSTSPSGEVKTSTSACTRATTRAAPKRTISLRPAVVRSSRWPVGCRSPRTPESLISVRDSVRSEEHTSELQSRFDLVCRLLLEKK